MQQGGKGVNELMDITSYHKCESVFLQKAPPFSSVLNNCKHKPHRKKLCVRYCVKLFRQILKNIINRTTLEAASIHIKKIQVLKYNLSIFILYVT